MENIAHLKDDRYPHHYNIDACTWAYEGIFDEAKLVMNLKYVLVGEEPFDGGMLEHMDYDARSRMSSLSRFSTPLADPNLHDRRLEAQRPFIAHQRKDPRHSRCASLQGRRRLFHLS
jgi:hypothetical protein